MTEGGFYSSDRAHSPCKKTDVSPRCQTPEIDGNNLLLARSQQKLIAIADQVLHLVESLVSFSRKSKTKQHFTFCINSDQAVRPFSKEQPRGIAVLS